MTLADAFYAAADSIDLWRGPAIVALAGFVVGLVRFAWEGWG